MRLKNETIKKKCDVLVIGAGLAGIMAAGSAAEAGVDVCLVSAAGICSGSSFYPGTWGLGLVGPDGREDEENLKQTILEIGEGMADPELVDTFVSHISDGIEFLQLLGVPLKEAENKGEKEFIPCFDNKNRDWHGIVKEGAREVFLNWLESLSVALLPDTFVLDAYQQADGAVAGVLALSSGSFLQIACKSLVIASGGLGGLFKYRLNTDDVTGVGQWLAYRMGANLVNLEFMQFMPGFLKPAPKTIYNEKVFRYTDFLKTGTGENLFSDWPKEELRQKMEIRSTHGPFTSRLDSAPVDIRLFEEFAKNPYGVTAVYREEIKKNQPEFVKTYFEWLEAEKHLTVDDPVQLGIFAHASNGGIRIDSRGCTGVPGLFACGEATGGMHGADRLGGLSTANGLVFGRIAGKEAGRWAAAASASFAGQEAVQWAAAASASSASPAGQEAGQTATFSVALDSRVPAQPITVPACYPHAEEFLEEIRGINFRNAMVVRSGEKAKEGLRELAAVKERMDKDKTENDLFSLLSADTAMLKASVRLQAACELSERLLTAAGLRKESRGSHYRSDYPVKKEEYSKPILHSRKLAGETYWKE